MLITRFIISFKLQISHVTTTMFNRLEKVVKNIGHKRLCTLCTQSQHLPCDLTKIFHYGHGCYKLNWTKVPTTCDYFCNSPITNHVNACIKYDDMCSMHN